MINFYSFKNKSYLISSILILFTIAIVFFKGLNLGIDFKGGLNFEIKLIYLKIKFLKFLMILTLVKKF